MMILNFTVLLNPYGKGDVIIGEPVKPFFANKLSVCYYHLKVIFAKLFDKPLNKFTAFKMVCITSLIYS
ncbi:hypothetical protein AFK20_03645 [Enhydrobacter aerosaccus]|uniref:Uncharacterized protein n=1 Tax=Enhydrobacter aerosaccus TaxID=225324 RepID=A0ABR5IQ08_9HYPH|nr:hypothetical protein AFK20_03645 [Enhydrobacter aerosaccus]